MAQATYNNNIGGKDSWGENLKMALDLKFKDKIDKEGIYHKFCVHEKLPQNHGKVLKKKAWIEVLSDENVGNLGTDKDGNPSVGVDVWVVNSDFGKTSFKTEAAADDSVAKITAAGYNATKLAVTAANNNQNMWGDSNDPAEILSKLPLLGEFSPNANQINITHKTLTASLRAYGNQMRASEEIKLFSDVSAQEDMVEELGKVAARVQDVIIQNGMINSAQVVTYANGNSKSDVGNDSAYTGTLGVNDNSGRLTTSMVIDVTKTLKRNGAKKTAKIISGSVKVGTTPVPAGFYAITHENVIAGLKKYNPKFIDIADYKDRVKSGIVEEEGTLQGMRLIEAPTAFEYVGAGSAVTNNENNLENNGSNYNVYPIIIPTDGAFAIVSLTGKESVQLMRKTTDGKTIDLSDTYAQINIFSYKFWQGTMALHANRLATIWVAA